MQQAIKIGTRGSPLALAQAEDVKARLVAAHKALTPESVEIVIIKTTGDIILDRPLMTAGGKGLFTKEIEEALIAGDIDCAVHSSKDMPTRQPEGLVLSTFLQREDARDVFISKKYRSFNDMPEGAVLGTSSLRRRAMALRLRPDIKVVDFRGNVQTRLKKLEDGVADATFLAQAGLNRLDMASVATESLAADAFLPAPAQGAVTVEIREADEQMAGLLAPLHCDVTALAVTAERAFLAALDGSCRTPIAAYATITENKVMMQAMLLSLDGQIVFERAGESEKTIEAAVAMGHDLGYQIRTVAGPDFFEKLAQDVLAEIV